MYLKKVTNFLNYYYYFFIFQLDPCIGRHGEVSRYNLNYNLDFRTTLFPGSLSLGTRLDFRKVCGMFSKLLHFPFHHHHHHHHHQLNYGWTNSLLILSRRTYLFQWESRNVIVTLKTWYFFFSCTQLLPLPLSLSLSFCVNFFFTYLLFVYFIYLFIFLFISLGEASNYDLYFPQKTLTSYVHQSWSANLSMFTVCFWMKTDDLSEGTSFSYAIRKPCCNEITLFKRHLAIRNQDRYASLVVVILLIRNPSQFPCWWFVFPLTPPTPILHPNYSRPSTLVISLPEYKPLSRAGFEMNSTFKLRNFFQNVCWSALLCNLFWNSFHPFLPPLPPLI